MHCSRFALLHHAYQPLTTLAANSEANLQAAAQVILAQIRTLADAPTHARSFLVADVYGRGTHTATGEAWKQAVFDGLSAFANGTGVPAPLNVAYADFSRIWDGVLDGPPGYAAFGYTNTSSCVNGRTLEGECDDPEHYFYWIPGEPSACYAALLGLTPYRVSHSFICASLMSY